MKEIETFVEALLFGFAVVGSIVFIFIAIPLVLSFLLSFFMK